MGRNLMVVVKRQTKYKYDVPMAYRYAVLQLESLDLDS